MLKVFCIYLHSVIKYFLYTYRLNRLCMRLEFVYRGYNKKLKTIRDNTLKIVL